MGKIQMLKELIELLKRDYDPVLITRLYQIAKAYKAEKVKVPDVLPDNQGTNPKIVTT